MWPFRKTPMNKADPPIPLAISVKGAPENYQGAAMAIPIRIVDSEIKHIIERKPYPHPNVISMTLRDREGRNYVMPPINVYGQRTYHAISLPHWDTPWDTIQLEFYYE